MCFPINTSRSVGDPGAAHVPPQAAPWLLSFLKARWRLCRSSALPATVEDTREWGWGCSLSHHAGHHCPHPGEPWRGGQHMVTTRWPRRPEGYSYRRWRGWWSRCRQSFQGVSGPHTPWCRRTSQHSSLRLSGSRSQSWDQRAGGLPVPWFSPAPGAGVSCLATIQFAQNKCIRQPILFKTLHSITQIHELIILVKIR